MVIFSLPKKNYDIFLGTSTGSLMVSHLALGKIDTLKKIYTLRVKTIPGKGTEAEIPANMLPQTHQQWF